MKPVNEWTEAYVQALVDQKIQESSSLEYKSCSALKPEGHYYDRNDQTYKKIQNPKSPDWVINEISKDVSSFANAGGGIIIYGVVEADHLPVEIDQYPLDPNEISREWLENVIDSNIQPKIDGITIKPIEASGANHGRVIYAVHVPQSMRGAHQANDRRYYQRRNFKAEPMEDYQVRDVMNRFNHPLLEVTVTFENLQIGPQLHLYGIAMTINNIGTKTAVNYGLDILLPRIFIRESDLSTVTGKRPSYGFTWSTTPYDLDRTHIMLLYRNPLANDPLFPSTKKAILREGRNNRIVYRVTDKNYQNPDQRMICDIYADDMPPKRQYIELYNNY